MDMIPVIEKAWSWIGLIPSEVIASNAFGNVIVCDQAGRYWRICPEELTCQIVANSKAELDTLLVDPEFIADWEMPALVEIACASLGPLSPDRCYCLKMPALLGGEYRAENLGTNSRTELIAFSGDVAEQIKNVPDGGKVEIRVVW